MILQECVEVTGGISVLLSTLRDTLNTTMRECAKHNVLDVSVGVLPPFVTESLLLLVGLHFIDNSNFRHDLL